MDPSVQDVECVPAHESGRQYRAGRDIEEGCRQGGSAVVSQSVPADPILRQPVSPLDFFGWTPSPAPFWFEGEQAYVDPTGDELAQVGKHLRLYKRLS
jgi:hypothetical protein